MNRRWKKRLGLTTLAALSATALLTAPSLADRPDRPPTSLHGAWSYSHSESQNGSSWSESLSVSENKAGYADIKVEEMVSGVTHSRLQSHVFYKDVNTVIEKLISLAKYGLSRRKTN